MPWLINASQVDKFRKNQKNVIIFDASWHLPHDNRDALKEFNEKHIVGAKFFNLNDFVDKNTSLPNMLLRDEAQVEQALGNLGITNDHKIIFYDNSRLHSSCRALWTLKMYGHNPNLLYILDGGLEAWEKYGGKFESGASKVTSAKKYTVNFQANLVRTLVQMKNNLHHPKEQVIDMRDPIRFVGGPEIKPGLRSGHIPGSVSFPFITMFESDGKFKPTEKIRKQLAGIGIDLDAPIVTSCGSGVTAAILNFQLDLLNHEQNALYDGSWSEWGADHVYPGETSLSERPVEKSTD